MKIRTLVEDPTLDAGVSILAMIIGTGAFSHVFVQTYDPALLAAALVAFAFVMVKSAVSGYIRHRSVSIDAVALTAFFITTAAGEYTAAAWLGLGACVCRLLCDIASAHAHSTVGTLLGRIPEKVRVVKDGEVSMVPLAEVVPGDIVRIPWVTMVPVDGVIVDGSSFVDSSALIIEDKPVYVKKGDRVYCGARNEYARIDVMVTDTGDGSTLSTLRDIDCHIKAADSPVIRQMEFAEKIVMLCSAVMAAGAAMFTSDITDAAGLFALSSILLTAANLGLMAAMGQLSTENILGRFYCMCRRHTHEDDGSCHTV